MKVSNPLSSFITATFLAALPVLAQDGWVNLFNGKNLDGWEEHSGRAKYTVEDGELIGESVSGTGNSFLCTRQPYGNFELELEFKCDALLNSGVQIRSLRPPNSPEMCGYQVDYGAGWYGKLYDESRRNKVVGQATDIKAADAAIHPGATELCNGIDDNCNGQIDEGVTTTFYRDADGDGRFEIKEKFSDGSVTGIAWRYGYLYIAKPTSIERYKMKPGELKPSSAAEVVVAYLPSEREHREKGIAFDDKGSLYINVGSPSNACQSLNRQPGVAGQDPCPILEKHGGIWKFDENKLDQRQSDGTRYATGMRQMPAIHVRAKDFGMNCRQG